MSNTDRYPHDDRDCHGTRCYWCGCCMHSDGNDCRCAPAPVGMRCPNDGCGCEGQS